MDFFSHAYHWVTNIEHLPILAAGSYALDKIVKATPNKHDDFIIDVVLGGLKRIVNKDAVGKGE